MTNDSPVLVVGGTGMLGGHVVTALLSRGKRVRALLRPVDPEALTAARRASRSLGATCWSPRPCCERWTAQMR